MKPAKFKESNFKFQKPKNMTDEQCSALEVYKGELTNGTPLIVSCWEFSNEEIATIIATGKLWLFLYSKGMPPVAISTENPFVEEVK